MATGNQPDPGHRPQRSQALPKESCFQCGEVIRPPAIACVNSGRILCESCDREERSRAAGHESQGLAPVTRKTAQQSAAPMFFTVRILGGLLSATGVLLLICAVVALVWAAWALSRGQTPLAGRAAMAAAGFFMAGLLWGAVGEGVLALRHIARNSFHTVNLLRVRR